MSSSASYSRSGRTSTSLHNRHNPPDDRLWQYQRQGSPKPSSFASSTFSAARCPSILHRSASPTRVSVGGSSKSVRFSIDSRAVSPHRRALAVSPSRKPSQPRRTCMCSPTNHPGSFRCSLHRKVESSRSRTFSPPSNHLNSRRSAMTNSLVRIGSVEGDLVKRALSALIRPSSHQQRRRATFQPRPSRLSVMSKAEDDNDAS